MVDRKIVVVAVRRRRLLPLSLLGAAILALEPTAAQETGGLSIEVSECLELESPAERLACFESRVDRALDGGIDAAAPAASDAVPAGRRGAVQEAEPASSSNAEQASAASSSDAEQASAAPSSDAQQASAAPPSDAEQASAAPPTDAEPVSAAPSSLDDFGFPRPTEEREPQREELHAAIADVRMIEPNRYMITLDNGQVWRQVRPERYRLKPGHHVRIYPTRWGESYRLSVKELRGFVQVQRVR